MVDLLESRKQIDEIDGQIVELFEKRMKVASDVADYKIATGKAVFDREREESKIQALKNLTQDAFNKKCIAELFSQIMAMSRKFQYSKLEMRTEDSKLESYEVTDRLPMENIKVICIMAAPEGIKNIHEKYSDVEIITATVDEGINEKGYIIPGMGDAGDRIFNT